MLGRTRTRFATAALIPSVALLACTATGPDSANTVPPTMSATSTGADGPPAAGPATLPAVTPVPQSVIFWRQVGPDRYLYLIREDGSGLTTLAATSGEKRYRARTADGSILFENVVDGQSDLYSVRPDGSALRAIGDTADDEVLDAVGADGRVVFHRDGAGGNALLSARPDGTDLRTLAASAQFLALGPDDRVYFSADGSLYSTKTDGTESRRLVDRWDAERLLGVTSDGFVIYSTQTIVWEEVYSLPTTGGSRALLAEARYFPTTVQPDGWVIYHRGGDVYSVRADGSARHLLAATTDRDIAERVEPNGRLVYRSGLVRGTPGESIDLYSVNLDGSDNRQLTHGPAADYSEAVAPSGRIVYRRDEARSMLRSVQDDASGDVALSTDGADARFLAATATDHVVYGQLDHPDPNTASHDLYVVQADGSGNRRIGIAAGYLGDTVDGRVIYSGCHRLRTEDGRWTCTSGLPSVQEYVGEGDLYAVRDDGTGTVSLADSPDFEGFAAVY